MPRSTPSLSSSGIAIVEARRSSSKAIKPKRSVVTVRKSGFVKSQDRLGGGADAEGETPGQKVVSEDAIPAPLENEENTVENKLGPGVASPSSGPCCFCASQETRTTGDTKVDEMIDYIHKNLQEAGKALATLGENFEHESKLIFVDILGRIQQWSGIVQNKLDVCKKDVETLRKELIARVCDINDKQREINNKEREINALKAQLADCELREHNARKKRAEENTMPEKIQQHTVEQPKIHEDTAERISETPEPTVTTDEPPESDEPQDDQKIPQDDQKIPQDDQKIPQTGATKRSIDNTNETHRPVTYKDQAVQVSENDENRIRREVEFQAEISQLRQENARILKERADYEQAIQRALLRGVSSLNVEALRVLRCPPIPCCTPCAPCPSTTPEPCTNTKDVPRTCNNNDSQRNGNGNCDAGGKRNQGGWTLKRPCGSPCCSAGKNRRSTANSLLFLLREADPDSSYRSCDTPLPSVCGSPILKKLEIPPCPRFSK